MRANDLTNRHFGSLKVVKRIGSRWGKSLWLCECECGKTCERTNGQLKLTKHPSCGCKTKECQATSTRTHGSTGERLYRIWKGMKTRCNNPNVSHFKYYGGKGIRVCDEWSHDYSAFKEWSLRHGYAEDLTIDRIDSDGNYEPDNCRWVDMTVQNRNKKGVTHVRENPI